MIPEGPLNKMVPLMADQVTHGLIYSRMKIPTPIGNKKSAVAHTGYSDRRTAGGVTH